MANYKTIRKTIAIVVLLCMMLTSVSFAAPGDPQQVKYIYFQDAGAGMVVVDFMQAINAAINGDPVLYDAIKAHLGTAVGNGSPIVIETTIGTVLDYQKALTQNKPSLVLFQDDATYQTAKPTYTSELTVVNGVASIVPLSIPVAPAVTNDDVANTVTGMAAGLEYSLDGAAYAAYDAVVFAALDFSGSHTLLVRVAAVGIVPAGAITTLTFTVNPVTPPAPAVTNDDVNDTVSGMAIGMEYSLDGGAYVAYDAEVFAALNFGGSHTLLVRIAAEGVNPPSADTVLIFTASGNEAAAAAVAAYEAAPISTLAQIAAAEALKPLADAAVATIVDAGQRLAFENRIAARAAEIAAAKAVLLGADAAAQAAAETAVAAFEAAPLTNIAQINAATGLKYTAEARIAIVGDVTAKAAFTQRVLVKTTAMAIAEINLQGYYTSIETALFKYNSIFGLDFTDYNALANKQPVLTAMMTPVFTTVAEINTAFNQFVAAQKTLEASPVSAFNAAADAAAIGAAITTHATTLSLGLTEYNTIANKTPVHTEMLGRGYTTGEDVRVAFAIAVINNTTDARVKTMLISNSKVLGLEAISEYTSLSTKNVIENAVIAAKPIADKLEIVVIAFNSTVNSGYIGQLLPINKGFLGLDMTVYDSLSNLNKLAVQSDLMAATLTSKADIQNAFNASVATRKASEDVGLAAFNNATDAAGIASAITTYIHPNDLGTYGALANKGAVHTTLLIQTFSSMVQVNTAFNAAVTDQKAVEDGVRTALNAVTAPAEMETFIQTNFLNLGLDLTNYNTLSAADKLPVLTVMIADTFYAMPVLKTTFDTAVAGQMAVAAVNSATAGTMGAVITTYAATLGLTTNDYALLSAQDKATVHGALEGKAFANKAAVVTAFEAAVAVPIINQTTTTTAMGTAINRYGTVLGLNMADYGGLYAPYNVTVQTALIGQNFADAAAVKAVFDPAVAAAKEAKAVAAINTAATNAAMNTAITNNAATLGLNLTDYNALTSKTPVQTALLAPVFTTAAEIRTAFNQAVAVQKVNEAVVAGMGSILVDKAVILGLDLTDYTALINKEPVHTALVSPVFANAAAVKTAFDTAVAAQKAIEDPGQNIPSVKLNKNATTLAVGGNEILVATVLPVTAPNKDVTWQSDNAGIATVNSAGNVTAMSAGTAVITVTTVDGGYTDTCTVTVVVPATGVTLNKTTTTMLLGSTETLIATVSPANATNKELIWTNETARATVDSTGKVTAVSTGVGSNITVKTVDGNFTATCYVRVVTEATAANAITQAIFTNDSMANTILEYASALGLDLTDYLALGDYEQGQVQMALLDPVFTTALQVQQVFYPAVAVQEINLAVAETMGAAIVKNASHLGLDLTDYNTLTSKTPVQAAMLAPVFTSAAEIRIAFNQAVAVQMVNEAVVGGMGAVLTNKAAILGLDLTDYTALINREPVHSALVSPVFANVAAVKTAFDTAVAAQKAIEAPGQNIPSVKLNKNAATLAVGGNETLVATVLPVSAPNKNVTWQSDNAAVAAVNNAGNITAVSAGTAVITVTAVDSGYTDTCTVTVVVPVTGVTLNRVNLTMLLGSTATLIATVSPDNATNKELIWTNETARATVDSTGKVTAVTTSVGSNITVKTADGNFTATCEVRVVTDAMAADAITQAVFNGDVHHILMIYASALGLDLTDYLDLGGYEQRQVQMALLNPVFTTALQVREVFYPAVAVQEINLAGAESMGAAIVKNSAQLGLDLTAYNLLTNQDSVHIALVDEIANIGPFATPADFKASFDAAVAAAGAPARAPLPEVTPPVLEPEDPALQTAEAAVANFEAVPTTTLEEIAMAEGLMTAAELAVAAVADLEAKAALEQRISVRAETVAKAQAALEALAEAALQTAAELSVAAYEAGSLLTLEEVAVAEALKAMADADTAAVGNQDAAALLEQRIAARAEAVAAARALLEQEEPAVEPDPEAPVQEEAPPVPSDAPVEDAVPAEGNIPAE